MAPIVAFYVNGSGCSDQARLAIRLENACLRHDMYDCTYTIYVYIHIYILYRYIQIHIYRIIEILYM